MSVTVEHIPNANVFLNGNSLLGKIKDFAYPDLKPTMVDYNALGMVGQFELPSGIDKMEVKMKFTSIYLDVYKSAYNPFKGNEVVIKGSSDQYEGSERIAQIPVEIILRGTFKGPGGGTFEPRASLESEGTFNALYMKLIKGGDTIVEYDAVNNIYQVGGEDLLATYRANLGI